MIHIELVSECNNNGPACEGCPYSDSCDHYQPE